MARTVLVLKLLGVSYLAYLLYTLAFEYDPSSSSFSPPLVLWLLDTINLFIHEAGHFFLKPLGRWMYIFGGSFFQVFLPLLLALVGLRQNYRHAILPAFWCGESLINVSVYIRDAPVRQLRLIAKGLVHDWNWLLSDHLDSAGTLADVVFGPGCSSVLWRSGWGPFVRLFLRAQDSAASNRESMGRNQRLGIKPSRERFD